MLNQRTSRPATPCEIILTIIQGVFLFLVLILIAFAFLNYAAGDANAQTTSATIVWDGQTAEPPLQKYILYLNGKKFSEPAPTATSATIQIDTGKNYKWEISAVNADGESGKSLPLCVGLPCAPTQIKVQK